MNDKLLMKLFIGAVTAALLYLLVTRVLCRNEFFGEEFETVDGSAAPSQHADYYDEDEEAADDEEYEPDASDEEAADEEDEYFDDEEDDEYAYDEDEEYGEDGEEDGSWEGYDEDETEEFTLMEAAAADNDANAMFAPPMMA